jgi:uncharacterized protein YecT (DUF1311 family)
MVGLVQVLPEKSERKTIRMNKDASIKTQADMTEESSKMMGHAEERMKVALAVASEAFTDDYERLSMLHDAQKAYMAFVEKDVNVIAKIYEGGSIMPSQVNMRYAEWFDMRAMDLMALCELL